MYEPLVLTEDQTRAWCHYLAAFHSAHTAMGNTVALPLSPKCTRRRLPDDPGCGTCYRCTEQIILRALFTALIDQIAAPRNAADINAAVFAWVTGLDSERLRDEDGDDYAPMTSPQYSRVMNWAATFVLHPAPMPVMLPRTYSEPATEPAHAW